MPDARVGNGDDAARLNKLERWAVEHNARSEERQKHIEKALGRNDAAHDKIYRELKELAKGTIEVKGAVIKAGALVAAVLLAIEIYSHFGGK